MVPGEMVHPAGLLKCCLATIESWTEEGKPRETRKCHFCNTDIYYKQKTWKRKTDGD